MALQIAMADSNVGAPAPEGYARIVQLLFDTKSGKVQVAVDVYYNKAARDAGKAPISGGIFEGEVGKDFPSLDDALPNGIRAVLYTWLKTKDPFVASIDV